MCVKLLTSEQAAAKLGISVLTLYDWLSQSDSGKFAIRGQAITINYFQGGRRGQGRIRIENQEVERLQDAMRVQPQPQAPRRWSTRTTLSTPRRVSAARQVVCCSSHVVTCPFFS